MNIAIYSRKSIETDTGQSIENQINMCKNYFSTQYPDANFLIFSDYGFSGGNTNRPDFQKMLNLAKRKQIDIIGVYKLDRVARNITDFFNIYSDLEKHNVKLVSITEGFDASTPIGRMMMTMLAGFADMERENIRQRVKDNMLELAKLGRWSGGRTPFGYDAISTIENGKRVAYLQLQEDKKEIIKEIFELASNNVSPYNISKKVNLHSRNIVRIIENPVYMISDELSIKYLSTKGFKVYGSPNGQGFLRYNSGENNIIAVSKHEGLIESKVWIKAYTMIISRNLSRKTHISQQTYLAHLVKCSCGGNMFVGKSTTLGFVFRCQAHYKDKEVCEFKSIQTHLVEAGAIQYLKQLLRTDKPLIKYNNSKKLTRLNQDILKLKKDINKVTKDIDTLTSNLLLISGPAITIVNEKINKLILKRNDLNMNLISKEEALYESTSYLENDENKKDKLKDALKDFENPNLTIQEKQQTAQSLFKEIIIYPDGKAEYFFL